MNGTWKDLLAFNKRERNGIFVLTFLIVCVAMVQLALPFFKPVYPPIDELEYQSIIRQIEQDSVNEELARRKEKEQKEYFKQKNKTLKRVRSGKPKRLWEPMFFDPNTVKESDWMRFGLSRKQAKTIEKYKAHGATFKLKSDVKKLFVIDDELFFKMKPYINLPDSMSHDTDKYIKPESPTMIALADENLRIELNATDTSELIKLKGIGRYYARKIIWYRNKLGGFYSVNQLYEIDRMRPETVQKIAPYVWVDPYKLRKIHINSTTAPEMVKHPYFTWNMAISIQDYRDFTKKFKSVHQLVEIGLLNEEIYSKLAPYLEL